MEASPKQLNAAHADRLRERESEHRDNIRLLEALAAMGGGYSGGPDDAAAEIAAQRP